MASKVELKVTSNLPQALSQTETAINKKLVAMANVTRQKLLMEVLVGNRSGRTYKVPKTKKTYQASAPGEAPASRLGDLRRSYKIGRVQGQGLDKTIQVGSDLAYAADLEEGTKKMKPRPHLEPAVKLSKPEHEEILRGDWGF